MNIKNFTVYEGRLAELKQQISQKMMLLLHHIAKKVTVLAKFEVASSSRCRNKENALTLGSTPDQGHTHFPSGRDFIMGLGKPPSSRQI